MSTDMTDTRRYLAVGLVIAAGCRVSVAAAVFVVELEEARAHRGSPSRPRIAFSRSVW